MLRDIIYFSIPVKTTQMQSLKRNSPIHPTPTPIKEGFISQESCQQYKQEAVYKQQRYLRDWICKPTLSTMQFTKHWVNRQAAIFCNSIW